MSFSTPGKKRGDYKATNNRQANPKKWPCEAAIVAEVRTI